MDLVKVVHLKNHLVNIWWEFSTGNRVQLQHAWHISTWKLTSCPDGDAIPTVVLFTLEHLHLQTVYGRFGLSNSECLGKMALSCHNLMVTSSMLLCKNCGTLIKVPQRQLAVGWTVCHANQQVLMYNAAPFLGSIHINLAGSATVWKFSWWMCLFMIKAGVSINEIPILPLVF